MKYKVHPKEWPDGYKECIQCGRIKSYTEYHKHSGCRGGVNTICKMCRLPHSKKSYELTSIEKRLYYSAQSRAKQSNLPFDLDLEDIVIPEHCPIFDVPLEYNSEHAPSIDRVVPSLGYVKGNICIMSKRANVLKNNGTVAEFKAIINFLNKGDKCEI